jgi:plastocyanin
MTPRRRLLSLLPGLSAALLVAACAQTSAPSATPSASGATTESAASPTTSSPSAASPATAQRSSARRIEISVKGKEITPAPATVNLAVGESLTIAVTSDHDDQLHAHGFEVEKNIKAGRQAEFTVKGAQTGVFDVELHHPELRLLQVAVR